MRKLVDRTRDVPRYFQNKQIQDQSSTFVRLRQNQERVQLESPGEMFTIVGTR